MTPIDPVALNTAAQALAAAANATQASIQAEHDAEDKLTLAKNQYVAAQAVVDAAKADVDAKTQAEVDAIAAVTAFAPPQPTPPATAATNPPQGDGSAAAAADKQAA